MREIKFRAWDKGRKKMYEVHDLILNQFPKENEPKAWANLWGFDIIEQKDIILHSENLELQQFTGLKDKDGKDVYEGDIVFTNDGVFEVFYHPSWASWELKNTGNSLGYYFRPENTLQVIGNIFENQELLTANHNQSAS